MDTETKKNLPVTIIFENEFLSNYNPIDTLTESLIFLRKAVQPLGSLIETNLNFKVITFSDRIITENYLNISHFESKEDLYQNSNSEFNLNENGFQKSLEIAINKFQRENIRSFENNTEFYSPILILVLTGGNLNSSTDFSHQSLETISSIPNLTVISILYNKNIEEIDSRNRELELIRKCTSSNVKFINSEENIFKFFSWVGGRIVKQLK